MGNYKVDIDKLKKKCDLDLFDFETTEELEDWEGIIGQRRAMESLEFGLSMKREGYNIYVSGLTGTGRNSYSHSLAKMYSKFKEESKDWCYVYNFKKPENPKAISFKKGIGKIFKKEVEKFISIIREEIPNSLSSKSYDEKLDELYKNHERRIERIVNDLNQAAKEYDFKFRYTEKGLITFPLSDGKAMSRKQLENLSEEKIKELKIKSNELQTETFETVQKLKNQENDLLKQIEKLDKSIIEDLVDFQLYLFSPEIKKNEKAKLYLEEVKFDIIENYQNFKAREESKGNRLQILQQRMMQDDFFVRYKVNLFIDNSDSENGIVVKEINPTYHNLLGKIEYTNQLGMLKTDHTKIKSGSLHEANGGYIIIQATDILKNQFSWEGLKRTLKSNQIRIENVFRESLLSQSLKPEPIPLDIKVILIGDSYIYQLLYQNDEDFKKLFRIRADFDIEMERNEKNINLISKFIAHHCREDKLLPFDKSGVCKIIEYSSRISGDQKKLTARFNLIVELLYEADALARIEKKDMVDGSHITKALNHRVYRNNKYEKKTTRII